MRILFAGLAILAFVVPTSAEAQAVSRLMSCNTARNLMDKESVDRTNLADLIRVVEQVYRELDAKCTAKGGPAIYARMSEDGKAGAFASLTARCELHLTWTVERMAKENYDGLLALNRMMAR